ncbi:unnamed protein product [Pedinophyceae sp. YPF-701]|nr:unnamed protein product [Pedinophyceae sp. YPF-701]
MPAASPKMSCAGRSVRAAAGPLGAFWRIGHTLTLRGGRLDSHARHTATPGGFGARPLQQCSGRGRTYASAAASTAGAPAFGAAATGRPPRVCILGGGFGGLYTAVKLGQLTWPDGMRPEVTLVDKSERFVFKPMLYELINDGAEEWEVAPTFQALLAPTDVRLVTASVGGVEAGADGVGGKVKLSDGSEVPYDWLVVALGARADPRGVPGALDHAIPFNSLEDAKAIKEALTQLERSGRSGRVCVVGGGYAGVELAACIAERMGAAGKVSLVTPSAGIMTDAPRGQAKAASEYLTRVGVDVVANTRVARISKRDTPESPRGAVVKYEGGGRGAQSEEYDLVCWTAGQAPSTRSGDGVAAPGVPFPRTEWGAMETDESLRVVNQRRVFALGDVSAKVPGGSGRSEQFPQTAQVAYQQADYVAWNIWASITGRPLLPFKYQHLGNMMSLGRDTAAVALPFELPSAARDAVATSPLAPLLRVAGVRVDDEVTIEGPLGAIARRAAYWLRQPTDEHRLKVGASWLRAGVRDAAQRGPAASGACREGRGRGPGSASS